ncbi:hypothetical protein GCM10007979_52900 [Nocardioides albus]|nr:hypothetical protein GCM10007979_52900 [Nocardioides albus]
MSTASVCPSYVTGFPTIRRCTAAGRFITVANARLLTGVSTGISIGSTRDDARARIDMCPTYPLVGTRCNR